MQRPPAPERCGRYCFAPRRRFSQQLVNALVDFDFGKSDKGFRAGKRQDFVDKILDFTERPGGKYIKTITKKEGAVSMARISVSENGATPFQQLLGHNMEIMEKWAALEEAFLTSPAFSPELKEEVRRALAFLNNCPYCMAKGKPSENLTDKKSRCAVKAAHALSQGEVSVDEVFEDLKSAFTDKEISELAAYICFISACQKSGAFLDLQPSCSIL